MNVERDKRNAKENRDLRARTKDFALRIIRLYVSLPKTTEAQVMGRQVLRSGTSVGAHYREATRARSVAEFVSKVEVGLQELEETVYWFELLSDSGIVPESRLVALRDEAQELIAIFVSSVKTAKKRQRR
ncbi:MAG: four helix bundle protein [Chloroflexi bacterium]|nr:four helix bundle protein [Chloroflexota bacterium]